MKRRSQRAKARGSHDSTAPTASGSLSRVGSKKRKSNQGEQLLLCSECTEKNAQIKQLSENLENLRLEITDDSVSKRQAEALEDMQTRYHEMKQKYEAEREAKDNALLRLSCLASSRLRDNNPNIADLSDKYRPTKLADMFSELYDNEWTDAYEALEKEHMKEKEIIGYLLNVIMFVYKECKTITEDQLNTLVKLIVSPFSETSTCVPDTMKDTMKSIKDYRKSNAVDTIEDVGKVILDKGGIQHLEMSEIRTYVEACVKICWLAVHQDPPVVLSIDQHPTSKFDSDRFKEYTKRGPYVDYVVWPALYLCEGGALLHKGVAQGMDSSPITCDITQGTNSLTIDHS